MSENKGGPPAKARYDAKFPVVSFRVTKEQAEKLDRMKEVSGKSHGDIMREALQLEAGKSEKIYQEGYNKGFSEAKKKFGVDIWCNKCSEGIIVSREDTKVKVGNAVAEVCNCYHEDCRPPEIPRDECIIIRRIGENDSKGKKRKRQR